MIETIQGSRCPACGLTVAPPAPFCPRDPVAMTPVDLEGTGEIVSFTTLHSPPAGFRSPLHIALVALEGGARFICHGAETRGLDRKSTRLNSSHIEPSRMPSSA